MDAAFSAGRSTSFEPAGERTLALPRRLAVQQVRRADVLVEVRPVNPLTAADELPVLSLRRGPNSSSRCSMTSCADRLISGGSWLHSASNPANGPSHADDPANAQRTVRCNRLLGVAPIQMRPFSINRR